MPLKRTDIFVLFSIAIILLSCQGTDTLFTKISSSKTNITFENKLEKRQGFGILYYLYYYNGGGVATGDVNNDGLPDIYFTANSNGNNKLYLNKGDFEFEDITEEAGVEGTADWCTGVTMADVNGDGYLDIYVSAVGKAFDLQGHNQLFINNGSSKSASKEDQGKVTFTESSARYGLDFSGFTTQSAFFDYDRDGDLDCYILNQSHQPNQNIVDTINRRKFDATAGDRLYQNNMNGPEKKFTDVSESAGISQSGLGYGLGLAVADINNDGWDDIYVGNDFHENDYYYVNNGNGTFAESGAEHFGHYSRFSMGNDVADYNNDGQLDLFTADMLPSDEKILKTYGSDENPDIYKYKLLKNGFQYQYSKNCLQRNNGNGTSFSETSLLSGVSATDWSWAPLFADFDNDGNKDLFISSGIVKRPVDLDYVRFVSDLAAKKAVDNAENLDEIALEKMPDGASHPYFYKGDGKLTFNDVSESWGTGKMKGYYNGASYADLNNDGNLDIIVNCIDAPAIVLKNNSPKKNYISVAFKGEGLNTMGIGCKAYIFQKQKMQYQQLMLTRGFQSSSDARLHFGLDSSSSIDSLLIIWPNQKFQVIKDVTANKSLTAYEKDAAGLFNYNSRFEPSIEALTNISDKVNVSWQHRENDFVDYNIQYLIPHSQSARGPKIAVADVNGDGLDDFYACGAKGQPGRLMIQQQRGTFISADDAVFNIDGSCEDVDATFFDANGDGSLDLYVVSGGNEEIGNTPSLLDRLYVNDGKGRFTKSTNSLPPIFENKSCVTVADVDNDGDTDIFVGNLANAKAYGVSQTSFLLINDGKAHFSIASANIIQLTNIGMVTSSAFADVNKDGFKDLIVAGEFMALTIFVNKSGKFEKMQLPNSTGWWQTVFIDDVNSDGNIDILAGNWGWNNKFWSDKNGPVRMYVSDFDKNGQTDQLLSYTLNGKEYPFLAKDEVERSLPLLKKHYLLYADYAGVPMKDVFFGWIDTIKPIKAERLGSAVCLGDGKGNFTISDLPKELQLAPIFSFQKLSTSPGTNMYLSGGNFFDVIPYEGRYDAQSLAMFSVNKSFVKYVHQKNLSQIKNQVRDIKDLQTARHGKALVVAANNSKLLFYRFTSSREVITKPSITL